MGNNLKKNFIWNLIGTSLNAFNSLFLMIIVVRINGSTDAGIFTLAFSLACLFCIIGGYEGRVFHVTDTSRKINNKEYIIHRFITAFLMIVITICYALIQGYNQQKFLIIFLLCILKCLEIIAEIYYGIIQKNNQLYKVGISLTLKSILSIFSFLIIDIIFKDLLISCIVIDLVWILMLLIYDIPSAKKFISKKEKINFDNVFSIFKNGFFAFALLFMFIFVCNVQKYVLDGRVSENIQTIFGIIIMPASVISLFGQYLLNPYLTLMSNAYEKKQIKELKHIVNNIFGTILVCGIIIVVLGYFLGIPILNFIYGINLNAYYINLLMILIGAILYTFGNVFYTVLMTMRKNLLQFIMYLCVSIFSLIISIIFIDNYNLFGATLSYLITMVFQFLLYFINYRIILKNIKKGVE